MPRLAALRVGGATKKDACPRVVPLPMPRAIPMKQFPTKRDKSRAERLPTRRMIRPCVQIRQTAEPVPEQSCRMATPRVNGFQTVTTVPVVVT